MLYEWNETKRQDNIKKHHMDFYEAEHFEWQFAIVEQDRRKDYGESRFTAIAPIKDRLCVMIYTVRVDIIRIISLRKANLREWRKYAQKN